MVTGMIVLCLASVLLAQIVVYTAVRGLRSNLAQVLSNMNKDVQTLGKEQHVQGQKVKEIKGLIDSLNSAIHKSRTRS